MCAKVHQINNKVVSIMKNITSIKEELYYPNKVNFKYY